jgi:hypothetical protein
MSFRSTPSKLRARLPELIAAFIVFGIAVTLLWTGALAWVFWRLIGI